MKKNIYYFLILFLFVLAGCKSERKFEKIIDFKVINYYEDNILSEKGCKIITSHDELRDSIDLLYLKGDITKFDYTNNTLILVSYEKNTKNQNVVPVGVKVVDDLLVVEVYIDEDGHSSSLFESFAIELSSKDIVGIEKVIVNENNEDYCKVTLDYYKGGCMLRYDTEYIRKGYKKEINNKYLDLETLTIYENVVEVNKDMYLYSYDENGIYGAYIKSYILGNNEYEFESGFTTLERIQSYNIVERNDEYIVINHQDLLYTFRIVSVIDTITILNLYSIEANNKLFNKEYHESKNILSILYNNDREFINSYISVELKEESYKLVFNDYPIFG